jgi:tetratricopeptide (TPR) repeat protein
MQLMQTSPGEKRIVVLAFTALLSVTLFCTGCVKRVPDVVDTPSDTATNELYRTIMLANYYKYSSNIGRALELFRTAQEMVPDNPEPSLQMAQFFLELSYNSKNQEQARQFYNSAITICRETVESFPDCLPARRMLADLLIDIHDLKGGVSQIVSLLGSDPENSDLIIELAQLYMEMSDPGKTLVTLGMLSGADTDSEDVLRLKGYAYLQLKQYDKALPCFDRLMVLDPNNYEIKYNYGILLDRMGQKARTETIMSELIEAYPKAIDARFYLAGLYQAKQQFDQAIDLLKPLAISSPVAARTRVEIGRLHILNQAPGQAEVWLRDAMEIEPENQLAPFLLALALSEQAKWDEAESVLDRILAKKNAPVQAFDLAAVLKAETGDIVEALRLLEKGILLHPQDGRLYDRMARVYKQEGYTEKAIEAYERGLTSIPGDRLMTIALAFLMEETGNWKASVNLLEPLLKQSPDDPELCNFIGYTLAEHNTDLKRAEKLVEKALESNPDSGAYLDSMGWVYFRKGKFTLAEKYLRLASEKLNSDPLVWDHLSQVLVKLDRVDEAIVSLQKAVTLNPDNADLSDRLNRIQQTSQSRE